MQLLMAGMAAWQQAGLLGSSVALAHGLDKLSNENVVDDALSNKRSIPSSFLGTRPSNQWLAKVKMLGFVPQPSLHFVVFLAVI